MQIANVEDVWQIFYDIVIHRRTAPLHRRTAPLHRRTAHYCVMHRTAHYCVMPPPLLRNAALRPITV